MLLVSQLFKCVVKIITIASGTLYTCSYIHNHMILLKSIMSLLAYSSPFNKQFLMHTHDLRYTTHYEQQHTLYLFTITAILRCNVHV